jgi:PAS domain S-box-containing protein
MPFANLAITVSIVSATLLVVLLMFAVRQARELRHSRHQVLVLTEDCQSIERQVTERTQSLSAMVNQLQLGEEQFRLITDLSPVHLFRTEKDGAATFISPGFLDMTGLSSKQALGLGWTGAVHADDRNRLLIGWNEAHKLSVVFQIEFRFRTASGDYRWYRARFVPSRDDTGAVTGWVGAVVDLHELTMALEERAAALEKTDDARRVAEEASRLKDEFLAAASHELRTPLNAIVGWVQVLHSGALPEGQQQHAIEAIERNTRVQTRLIEDLLDVSRMIQGRVSIVSVPVDLRMAVDQAVDTIRPAASAKRIELIVGRDPDPVIVMGEEHRLQQIVWNLLSNAVKYTPKDGRVTISVTGADSRATLRVSDSGVGIAPEFLPHLFEPFRQANRSAIRSGLGLGLAIVRRLVDLHGGDISASSEGPGLGSEFVVTLPTAQASATEEFRRARSPSALAGVRVLLAEDDADSAAALTAILNLRGCESRTAQTAAECLRIIKEWPADVLLCDVGLPDDDGYSLLRRLRALPQGSHVPAIALTALARDEDRARALAAGFRAHVSKPFEVERLMSEISSAVESAGAS